MDDTQWTETAKRAYIEAVEAFIEGLRDHARLNLQRAGQHLELAPYMQSVRHLRSLGASFDDAEFDWCGSFPLGVEDGDGCEGENEEEQPNPISSEKLSIIGRWDFEVLEDNELIELGRESYRASTPGASKKAAKAAVTTAEGAAAEVFNNYGLARLEKTEGLELSRWVMHVAATHEDDDQFDSDPFGVVRPSEGD